MDEIIDYLIKFLKGEDSVRFSDGSGAKGRGRLNSKFELSNRMLFDNNLVTTINGVTKVAPEIYERIAQIEDRKEIILSALTDRYNSEREKLARIIFDYNPLAFLSKEEIKEILTPEKVKELNLRSSSVESLIRATGEIEKYLNSKTLDGLGLSNYSISKLIEETGDIERYLKPEIIQDVDYYGGYYSNRRICSKINKKNRENRTIFDKRICKGILSND